VVVRAQAAVELEPAQGLRAILGGDRPAVERVLVHQQERIELIRGHRPDRVSLGHVCLATPPQAK
jgi:hypothetical protein